MGGSKAILTDRYTDFLVRISKTTALISPLVMLLYGLLIHFSLVPRSPLYSLEALLLITVPLIGVGLWEYFAQPKYSTFLLHFVTYHLFAGLYFILVANFTTAAVAPFILLIFLTEIFLGRRGMIVSMASVGLIAALSFVYATDHGLQTLAAYTIYLLVLLVTAGLAVSLRHGERIILKELQKTRSDQAVQHTELLTILNSVNKAIITTDTQGQVALYNAGALNILDTNQSLAGKPLDDVLSLYDGTGEPYNIFADKKPKSNFASDEYTLRLDDGEEVDLDISLTPIRDNNTIKGYIILMRDITKIKSLDEERDEFISVVSHELRTPVTIAEGTISNVQMLIDKGASPDIVAKSLETTHDQILYLAKMVNDLSTLSRAERGVGDSTELIDVQELVNDLYQEYRKKAIARKLKLDLNVTGKRGKVLASRLYLEEVLQNFLTNAIKYTPKGTVTLSAKVDDRRVEFAVRDTGIGISKNEQKRIFDKFYRSEDYRTRETNGTGLGLYIVRKLARKLDISIKVDSRLNHGSTFSFSLPLAPVDKTNAEQ